MQWLFIALVFSACLWSIVDDVRHRSVSILCLLMLVVGLSCWIFGQQSLSAILQRTGLNVVVLILELFLVWSYFSAKHKKAVSFFDTYIGWGDIVMLLSFCLVFNIYWFVVFLLCSCIISLLFWIIYSSIRPSKNITIPFAAMMGICFIPIFIADIVSGAFCICNDDYIYRVLYNFYPL